MSAATMLKERSQIAERYQWNQPSVFESPEEWEQAVKEVREELPGLLAYQGRLGESAAQLLSFLEVFQTYQKKLGKINIYALMTYSVDTTDQAAAARNGRARGLTAEISSALAFVEPEIMAIGEQNINSMIAASDDLAVYRHYFTALFNRKPHIRSIEVEELLNALSDPMRSTAMTHSLLSDADLQFAPATGADGDQHTVAQGTIGSLLTHDDRSVRRSAWESYADGYLVVKHSLANNLMTGVKMNVLMSRARRYDSALQASLAPNQIPESVFHNLLDVFKKNLPTWHRYWRLRKRVLRLSQMEVYDIKAPLTDDSPEVSYEQAVEWISEGLAPMGDEYVSNMRRGIFDQRWVDVYPNKGKRSGAFSAGGYGTFPFINMSYADDVFSLSTLAHELGHSMHSYYSWKTQPGIMARYTLFAAEVASNFHQALTRDYLLRTLTDREMQIALIEEAFSNFHRYLFIMPTLARFELEIHQRVEAGKGMSAGDLNKLLAGYFAEGYGDVVNVDTERVGITWAQFPNHMYANFYVFQYATGIAGAQMLAKGVLGGHPGAVERYMGFLKAGGSKYPIDALREAGVDLASPEPVQAAYSMLADLVDRLEAHFPV